MESALAIDLGTSGVKVAVVDSSGQLLASSSRSYPIASPSVEIALQHPVTWWQSTLAAAQDVVKSVNVSIDAIGLTGQMHGTVLLDDQQQPVYPAIIWPDQRASKQVDEMLQTIGVKKLARITGTAPATGFLGPTLLWLKQHRPELLARSQSVTLPKDYLRLRLTNTVGTDWTDAAGTALFNIKKHEWATSIIKDLELPREIFPTVSAPTDVVGHLEPAAARALGLRAGIPVVAGCADQVAQAVANNLLLPGSGSVTIGSGGQIFIPLAEPAADPSGRLHTFCHAPADRWYVLGAMLSAGLALRWYRDLLGLDGQADAFERLSEEAAEITVGSEGLFFLPYLSGERSPLMDPAANGTLHGLRLRHGRGHIARAIMEGVCFSLRHITETMQSAGAQIEALTAVGNGLGSPVWRQMLADVLGVPLNRLAAGERTATGAALLAFIGTGALSGYDALADTQPVVETITEPDANRHAQYLGIYEQWRTLYPAIQGALGSSK